MIEELGEAIDRAWFAKAVATEDKDKSILTLTMPTRFMSDWIKNNYSHVIRRLSEGCGVNRVEYGYFANTYLSESGVCRISSSHTNI